MPPYWIHLHFVEHFAALCGSAHSHHSKPFFGSQVCSSAIPTSLHSWTDQWRLRAIFFVCLFCFGLRGGWLEAMALLEFPLVYSSTQNKHVTLLKPLNLLRYCRFRKRRLTAILLLPPQVYFCPWVPSRKRMAGNAKLNHLFPTAYCNLIPSFPALDLYYQICS